MAAHKIREDKLFLIPPIGNYTGRAAQKQQLKKEN